ncbi:hypothetical protein J6590_042528 [Homalodisca vitripennis]|nr:hypothetical protein J6590_042528 [Homalodisca vitripennis]
MLAWFIQAFRSLIEKSNDSWYRHPTSTTKLSRYLSSLFPRLLSSSARRQREISLKASRPKGLTVRYAEYRKWQYNITPRYLMAVLDLDSTHSPRNHSGYSPSSEHGNLGLDDRHIKSVTSLAIGDHNHHLFKALLDHLSSTCSNSCAYFIRVANQEHVV